jgi:CelD/BcsL family acetyltransferase involved in cellulose biosynthesis
LDKTVFVSLLVKHNSGSLKTENTSMLTAQVVPGGINAARGPDRNTGSTASKPGPFDINIFEGAGAVERAAEAWAYLEERGGVATAFQSYPMAAAYGLAHERTDAKPRIVVLNKNGKPHILVPTVITKLFGLPVLRFLGDPFIQYGDIISLDAEPQDIELALDVAADPKVACLAVFRRVRDDARIAAGLAQKASETANEESPLVDLNQPSTLRAGHVRELRRLRRRLSERGQIKVQFVRGVQALKLVEVALHLKQTWLKERGRSSAVIGNAAWEEAISHICSAPNSPMIAAVITCGNDIAAVEIAFATPTSWFAFIGAFSPEYAQFGPGQILAAECIQWARENHLSVYDSLPPSQDYKRRQATHAIGVRDYAMPLTTIGQLPASMLKTIPSIKWILNELPDDVRSMILKLRMR